MTPLHRETFLEKLPSSEIRLDMFPDETFHFELLNGHFQEISANDIPLLRSSYCLVAGREQSPPFQDFIHKIANPTPTQAHLADYRFLETKSDSEIREIAVTGLNYGHSVDNDFYLIHSAGDWMAYVSHHDEILLYTRRAEQGA